MSGFGLQKQLDRVTAQNDLMRRERVHDYLEKMEISPVGPIAQVMLADYRPRILEDPDAFSIQVMTDWLIDAFGGHPPPRSTR